MNTNEAKFLLIGNGRLARHLAHYFKLLNISYSHWYRKCNKDLLELSESVSHVLLAISDDAIPEFYQNKPVLHGKKVVHFSGANSFDFAVGAHPLMTFTKHLYDRDFYPNIYFIVDRQIDQLSSVLPGLSNPFISIAKEKRAYYHSLCVLGGNFPVLLWKKVLIEFETRLGIPRQALWPYLEKTLTEFIRDPDNSLTGPIARGDLKTIARNLEALKGDKFFGVYEAIMGAQ